MTDRKPKILLCDDDIVYLAAAKRFLTRDHVFEVTTVSQGDQALVELKLNRFDLVLLDVNLQREGAGLTYLEKIRALDPEIFIVMLSGEKKFETVRKALLAGAQDYLAKDLGPDEILFGIQKILETRNLKKRVQQVDFELESRQQEMAIVGNSPKTQELKEMIERAGRSSHHVIITGDTGVGKELVARALRGRNAKGELHPFVAVDAATIQNTMAESHLFGHEKGAFTGAEKARRGLFEEADGGIIYFDEIENMPLDIQAKLLRVIQEKEIVRLGSNTPLPLEFRVVCSTNKDLSKMVAEGKFKADLYQRLNVIPIRVPSLKERSEDIEDLVHHFAEKHSYEGKQIELSDEALAVFLQYSWPGNIRELSNLVAYLTAMRDEPRIEWEDLPPEIRFPQGNVVELRAESSDANYHRRMAIFEKQLLEQEFSLAQGNISKLAQRIGLDRSTLYAKLAMHGIYKSKSPRAAISSTQ